MQGRTGGGLAGVRPRQEAQLAVGADSRRGGEAALGRHGLGGIVACKRMPCTALVRVLLHLKGDCMYAPPRNLAGVRPAKKGWQPCPHARSWLREQSPQHAHGRLISLSQQR
jgi:hypothetical protein